MTVFKFIGGNLKQADYSQARGLFCRPWVPSDDIPNPGLVGSTTGCEVKCRDGQYLAEIAKGLK